MFPRGQIAAMLPLDADRDLEDADALPRLDEPAARPRPSVRILIADLGGLPAAVHSPDAAT
jgi:hypothetical protein